MPCGRAIVPGMDEMARGSGADESEDLDALPPVDSELEPGEAHDPPLPDLQIPEPGRTLSAVSIRVGPDADFVDLLVRLRERHRPREVIEVLDAVTL